MIFENPGAFWLLLALPPILFGLGFLGWRAKKEAITLFPLSLRRLRRKQIEKYAIAAVLMVLLIIVLAMPKVTYYAFAEPEKTGEIVLLVDTTRSMAARKDLDSPNSLEKVKPILYEIIQSMEELGQVKISLCGFNDIVRSHVPFVGIEDYPYLKASIKEVLDINSTPGSDTSLGRPIVDVIDKFSEGEHAKIIIMFSDGEPFYWGIARITDKERVYIDQAVGKVIEEGIKVITVGAGEPEGAKVPLYDDDGEFTGNYATAGKGIDHVFYLNEDVLKEISSRTGGEYFSEENIKGLTELIEENLDTVETEHVDKEVKVYHSIAHWFLLASLPVWVVFVRRHILG